MLQKGISVITVPIFTRLLPTAEYGTYSVFLSWLEIFEIITTLRLFYGAYIVGLVKFDRDKDCYTSSLEWVSSLITLFFLLIYLAFHSAVDSFTELTMPLTLLMFGYLFAVPGLGFWSARQRVENRYIKMVVVTLLSSVLTPALGIAAILMFSRQAVSVISAKVLVQVGITLFLLAVFHRQFFNRIKVSYWKYALRMNLPLVPYYLSTVVLNHSDRILIQRIAGSSQAGIYSVAYSAAMVMQLFGNALNSSVQPWLYKRMKADQIGDVGRIVNGASAMIASLNFMLILLAPEVVAILAPKQYHEAVWIIPPVAASVVIMYLYQQFINVEFYYEEGRMISIASIGSAVLNILLNLWLIPIFGYLVAGYTTLFSYLVFGIAHYFFMVKICRKHGQKQPIYDIRFMRLLLLAFLLFTAAALCVYSRPWLRYGIIVLACAALWWKRKAVAGVLARFKPGSEP